MIINEEHKAKLIELVKKDIKENPYNEDTKILLKELEFMKSENNSIMTKEEVKYVVDITKIFEEAGLLNIREGKIKKEEMDNMKKLLEKVLELEKLKKNFYKSTKNNINDYKVYKSQLDTFCINIGELFLEMANNI